MNSRSDRIVFGNKDYNLVSFARGNPLWMKVSFQTVTVELSLQHKVQFYKSSIGAKQERSELE